MLFPQSREELRQFYCQAWQKLQNQQAMSPLEQQIAQVILEHPEYHQFFNQKEASQQDFLPEFGETNPFLHLGLHLSIREQVATDRPSGIRQVFEQLVQQNHGDKLATEHLVADHLAEQLWLAQKNNTSPDEQAYLASLRELVKCK